MEVEMENEEDTIVGEMERSREENILKNDEDDDDDDEEDEIPSQNLQQDDKNMTPDKSRYTSVKRAIDPSVLQSKEDPGLSSNVSFNVVVNWGEEWKICKGDAYPESVAVLEGELDIPASDFEDMLSYEEKLEFNAIISSEGDIDDFFL